LVDSQSFFVRIIENALRDVKKILKPETRGAKRS